MFGLSGIWEHWESTATALVAFATTIGLLTVTQSQGISSAIPTVAAAIAAIVGIIKLFYKGES